MKRKILTLLLLTTLPAFAQEQAPVNLDNGIARMQALESNAEHERAAQQQQAEADRRRQRQQAVAAERKRSEAHAAAQAQANRERQAAVNRQRAIEDQDRSYENRYKELQLKKLEAQVARENDRINADLARSKAETDAVQSQADANRNVSKGVEKNLKDANRHWWEK
ncbi:DUF5384 family protein [Burkholderia ubonensis]|uniref:DUF5384 family protein n=1 Tax=Burkholderia ubonensis TaxID=101571 RepID=UPI000753164A|nr:DUF5384 family protein [Burkholderia ubonensis]KVA13831.1 hypothetical protein WI42_21390 [Burkholderia ubonensis]KVA49543.1 hypothetical protein WI46_01675 [Burkholderia ubonensis]